MYHSTLGWRVIKKKKKPDLPFQWFRKPLTCESCNQPGKVSPVIYCSLYSAYFHCATFLIVREPYLVVQEFMESSTPNPEPVKPQTENSDRGHDVYGCMEVKRGASTPHPTPYTLHPTTLHPYTPTPLHPTTLQPTPHTLTPYTLHPTPYTPTPYTRLDP